MRFASSAAAGRRFFTLPRSCRYGLSAGLFSGLVWALYAGVVRLIGPIPASAGLLSQLIVPGLLLLPAFVVLVIGIRLGWRSGSVLDGLIAGVIASIAFTLIYSVTRSIVMWGQMVAEAHAEHLPLWFELLASLFIDVLGGIMFVFVGICLGSLGALAGWWWHAHGSLAWSKLSALIATLVVASKVVTQAAARHLPPKVAAARRVTRPPSSSHPDITPVGRDSSSTRNGRLSLKLPSLVRSFSHKRLRPPTSRKMPVYGIITGFIPGVLYIIMELLSSEGWHFTDANRLVFLIFIWGIVLAPVFLVAACSGWLGSRTGSVRDGLLAGAIAGACFWIVYMLGYELIVHRSVISETREWHESAINVLKYYATYDLVNSAFCGAFGALVGGLAALVGRRWHRRGQLEWQESAGLAVSRIEAPGAADAIVTVAPGEELVSLEG